MPGMSRSAAKRKGTAKNWTYVREPCVCKTRKALQNVLFQHEVMNFKGEHSAERKAPGMSLGESNDRLWELVRTGVASIDLARAQKANGTYELNEPSFMIINTSALFVHVKQHLLDDEKMMKDRGTLTHLMKVDDSESWNNLSYNLLKSKLYTNAQDAKLFDDDDHIGYYVQPIKDLDNEHPHPLVVMLDKTEKPTLFASRKSTRLLWDCRSKHVVSEVSGYMSFDSVKELQQMMVERGIDPTEYSDERMRKGGPNMRRHQVKTLDELFCELVLRNSQLYAHPESEGGAVVRVENLLTLKVQQSGKLLVQTHQQLADGRVQEMWQLLGCKLPPQELHTPLSTALRAIKQELGLEAGQIKLVEESYTKSRETPSDGQGMYPGIQTQQVRHTIDAFTEALPVTEGAGTFVTIDKMSHDRNLKNRKIFWALYSENVWLTMCHNFLKVKPQEELQPIKYKNISHRVNSVHAAKKEVSRVMGHMRRLSMVGITGSVSKLKRLGQKAHNTHLNAIDAAAAATAAHAAQHGGDVEGDIYQSSPSGKGRRMSIVHVGQGGAGDFDALHPLAETHVKLYDDHEQFIKTKVDVWLSQKILKQGTSPAKRGRKATSPPASPTGKGKQQADDGGQGGRAGGQAAAGGGSASSVHQSPVQQFVAASTIVNVHVSNPSGNSGGHAIFGSGPGGGGGAASAGRDKFRGRGVPFWTRSRSRKPGAKARAERAKRARERSADSLNRKSGRAGCSAGRAGARAGQKYAGFNPQSISQSCLDGESWRESAQSLGRMNEPYVSYALREPQGDKMFQQLHHGSFSTSCINRTGRSMGSSPGLPGIEKKLLTLSRLDVSMANVPASACSGSVFASTTHRFKPQKEDYFYSCGQAHAPARTAGQGKVAYTQPVSHPYYGKGGSTGNLGGGAAGRRHFSEGAAQVW
jgi:hypothetical protein